ncbi:MAG TPA: FtsX-like permease family protein [Cyclobacteriaceae bacterium]|nr:FtsX-like permease family protein [Cyclobacteriaceae bacterium]
MNTKFENISLRPMPLFTTRLFIRIIYRNREVYILKIVTLAIAFVCSTLILLFSLNEFRYDHFHREAGNVFRVIQRNLSASYSGNRFSDRIPYHVFKSLQSSDSLIVSRMKVMNELSIAVKTQVFHHQKVHAVDSTIKHIFTFHILDGSAEEFNHDRVAMLSYSRAREYFGNDHAVGKKLKLYTITRDTVEVRVVAVYEDFPQNSHDAYNLFISFDPERIRTLSFNPLDAGVYGRVKNGSQPDFQSPIRNLSLSEDIVYRFQPLREIYFGPRVLGEEARHGDYYSILILISIAGLILFLALFSFINLTMLTLPHRSKELAIKKLAGTGQTDLFFTFARETFSIVGISLLLGLSILVASIKFIQPAVPLNFFASLDENGAWLILMISMISILLGVAPLFMALKFIRAAPTRLLSTETITFPRLKGIIAFLQLGISIFLIATSVVIKRQINYSLLKEPGRNYDQIVYMSYPKDLTNEGLISIREGWKKYNPNIVDVIGTSQLPDRIVSKELNSDFYFVSVDPEYINFFDLKLLEGNWFKANDGDSIMVVNEKGKALIADDSRNVRGIVKDLSSAFNQPERPLKINIAPYFRYNFLCIKILEVDIRRTVKFLSNFYDPSKPVKVSYLNKGFAEWIAYQDRLNRLSEILAVISALLSCCAIYGLSVSLVRDKIKEIAVHKLFGAGSANITVLLVKEFTRQTLIAIAIFGPVTYIFIHEFLRNFVYSTRLNWLDPFFPLAYCAIVITLLCALQARNLNRSDLSGALKGS